MAAARNVRKNLNLFVDGRGHAGQIVQSRTGQGAQPIERGREVRQEVGGQVDRQQLAQGRVGREEVDAVLVGHRMGRDQSRQCGRIFSHRLVSLLGAFLIFDKYKSNIDYGMINTKIRIWS